MKRLLLVAVVLLAGCDDTQRECREYVRDSIEHTETRLNTRIHRAVYYAVRAKEYRDLCEWYAGIVGKEGAVGHLADYSRVWCVVGKKGEPSVEVSFDIIKDLKEAP